MHHVHGSQVLDQNLEPDGEVVRSHGKEKDDTAETASPPPVDGDAQGDCNR